MVAEIKHVPALGSAQNPSMLSELRYRRLFESSTDGILIADATTGRITDVNARITKLFGYQRQELLNQKLSDVPLLGDPAFCHGILRELHTRDAVHREHLRLKSRHGRRVDAELLCSLHREGNESIIQCNLRDITEGMRYDSLLLGQKRVLEMLATGEALRDVLATLVQVIEGQSEGVLGSILVRQRNDNRFRLGVAPSLPSAYVRTLGQAAIAPPYFGPCAMAADIGEPVGTADIATDRRWASDWRQLALEHGLCTCYSSPIFASDGRLLGSFGLYQCGLRHAEPPDPQLLETATHLAGIAIERRQVEKALRESDRRKDEFLAMLSHELRNPLAAIRNGVHLLRICNGDSHTVETTSGVLERQVGQMVRLVDDLLEVGRISRGKVKLSREPVELGRVVQQAVEATTNTVELMQHKLTVELPPEPIYVDADFCRLAQVVGNLLDNACKYTNRGGQINLNVSVEADQVVVRVKDNGIGIDASQLNRIFDMFTQVDDSLERPHKGLGLGLTLVKNLVEMHGGTVEAHSKGLNRGSEFVVRLPTTGDSSRAQPTALTTPQTQTLRILIVDDEMDAAATLATLLELNGHETRTVHHARGAVDAAAAFEPHVVLLDIGMPEMNGYEVARRMRQQLADQKMALVALTGWGQDEDRRRSREAGFDGHLVKPAEYSALTKMIAELSPA